MSDGVGFVTTQQRHPWRTVIRTVFQIVVGFGVGFPIVVSIFGNVATAPALASYVSTGLALSATITRVMADSRTEDFLRRVAPWLAAGKVVTDTALTVSGLGAVLTNSITEHTSYISLTPQAAEYLAQLPEPQPTTDAGEMGSAGLPVVEALPMTGE